MFLLQDAGTSGARKGFGLFLLVYERIAQLGPTGARRTVVSSRIAVGRKSRTSVVQVNKDRLLRAYEMLRLINIK